MITHQCPSCRVTLAGSERPLAVLATLACAYCEGQLKLHGTMQICPHCGTCNHCGAEHTHKAMTP
jgi:hypothetical protein